MSSGWSGNCGCRFTVKLSSQEESETVMMPPVAVVRANGSRPESSSILSVSADFLAVIVNDSQEVFSQPGVNTSGRPKPASLAASERHRFQQPPCSLVTSGAAEVIEP